MGATVRRIVENGLEVWVAELNGKEIHRAHSEAGVRTWLLNQKNKLANKG